MEQELSSACRAAADALEVLSHLRPGFTRNVVPRLNSTSVSPRQANNGERLTVNREEPGERQTINEESAVQSTSSPVFTNSSIQTRLTTLFPTLGSNRASRKSGISRRTARPKQPIKSSRGRPSKTVVYKDLVIIPSPKINKVPTHNTRLNLEERDLVCHEFPFDKCWDANSLKSAILNRFPKLLLFEYVKVCSLSSQLMLASSIVIILIQKIHKLLLLLFHSCTCNFQEAFN